jgi:gamma-glutamyltranspeptidase/glutathione hydrolase
VLSDGKPWLLAGSPGSQRIFSSLAQFLCWVIDGEVSIGTAVVHPRIYCAEDRELSVEYDRFDPEIVRYLEERGFHVDRCAPYSFFMGAIQAVLRRHSGEGFQGVADVRRDGSAGGL